jgi:hypothetical protein
MKLVENFSYRSDQPVFRDADLYHGTSLTNLLEILSTDCLGKEGMPTSLTRNLRYALRFAHGKASIALEEWTGIKCEEFLNFPSDAEYARVIPVAFVEQRYRSHEGAILVLDQDRLKQRYKIKPYDDSGNNLMAGKWEMEERLKGRLITLIKPFIKSIIVGNSFENMKQILLHGSRELSVLPQPQYMEAISFIVKTMDGKRYLKSENEDLQYGEFDEMATQSP